MGLATASFAFYSPNGYTSGRSKAEEDAVTAAKDALLKVLNAEHARVRKTSWFKSIVEDRAEIEIAAVNWDVGTDVSVDGASVKVNIAAENVEDLFEATGRKLNEGLHKDWWRERVKAGSADRDKVKLELFALCAEAGVLPKVEAAAQALVQKWIKTHAAAIAGLGEERLALYDEIKALAADPELATLAYPSVLQSKQGDEAWDKHLYVDSNGEYHMDFNGPERDVLREEIAKKKTVGWLRNTDRKPWALCVPYDVGGEKRPAYPDFLFLRADSNRIVVDIIEPHEIAFADAPAKAAGYANFAAKHFDQFGAIDLILLDGKARKRLDLTDEATRNRLRGVTRREDLRLIVTES